MRLALWIIFTFAASGLLAWGVARNMQPAPPVPLTAAEVEAQVEALAVRLNAAIENDRPVEPIYAELRPLLDAYPDTAAGQRLLGQVLTRRDDVPGALAAYERALSLGPPNAQLENLAGTAAMMLDHPEKAERHHRRAVELAPEAARLRLPLGDVHLKAGRWDAAIAEFERALELDTTLHEAAAALSDTYAGRGGTGDDLEALDWMERAVAKLPITEATQETRVAYARKLAALYAERGDVRESVAILTSLSPVMLYSPGVSQDLAGYYEALGQPLLAALHYEIVLQEHPTDTDAAARAARYYLQGGDAPAARTLIRRLAQLDPSHEALPALQRAVEAAGEAVNPPARPSPSP